MEGQSPSEDSFRCETPLGCSARRRVSWVRGLPPSGSSSFALTWPMYKIGSMALQHIARLPCRHMQCCSVHA